MTQQVSLNIVIPKSTTSTASSKRGAQYIPANTGSLTLTLISFNGTPVTGATAQGPYNLSPTNNPNCTVIPSSGNTSCTFSVSAPVGKDIFLANTFSSNNGSGQSLGSGAIAMSITANAANKASLVLAGPVASVSLLSSITTLTNGNPQISETSNNRAPGQSNARSTASNGQKTLGAITATPAPSVITSRVFVIAVDSAGNQIINPTTFDIPITIQLNLNGATAGTVSVSVQYAGLPGEPSSAPPLTTDGSTFVIYAPSDVVTMTLGSTTQTANNYLAPSLVAKYTPQGGSPQTSPALGYTVLNPPPNPALALGATHTGTQFTVGTAYDLTFSSQNIGTLASSGAITLVGGVNTYGTFNSFGTTSSFWSCTETPGYGYFSFQCTSNGTPLAVYPATAPNIDVNFTPSSSDVANGVSSYFYWSGGGGFVNYVPEATDSIPVVPITGPQLSFTAPYHSALTDGNFGQGAPATILLSLANSGPTATSGTTQVVDSLPAGMTLTGSSGSGWTCTGTGTSTATCTTGAVIAATNGTAPQLSLFVSGPTSSGSFSNAFTVSSTGATQIGTASESIFVYGPLGFTLPEWSAPTKLQLVGAPGAISVSESGYSGTFTATIQGGTGTTATTCAGIISLGNSTSSGPSGQITVNPIAGQVTGAGNTCDVHIHDGNGIFIDVPITVTTISGTGN